MCTIQTKEGFPRWADRIRPDQEFQAAATESQAAATKMKAFF